MRKLHFAVLWIAIAIVLLGLRVATGGARPAFGHDSFQYLAAADQALRGSVGATPLIHWDLERCSGAVPAPMVHFPLGYPLLVASLGLLGMPVPIAALVLNLTAAVATAFLLWLITGRLGLDTTVRHVVLLTVVLNASFLQYATTASTEMPFTLVILGAATLLLRSLTASTRLAWLLTGLAFGAAYHIRYAGLFFVVGLGVLAVVHTLRSRHDTAKGYAIALAAAVAFVSIGLIRNLSLVGNWRGGNEKAVSNPILETIIGTIRAAKILLVGSQVNQGPYQLVEWIFWGAVLGAGLIALRAFLRAGRAADESTRAAFALDLSMLVAVYGACMFYAGVTSIISYGARMFAPVLPLIAIIGGAVAHRIHSETFTRDRVMRVFVLVVLIAYAVLNLRSLRSPVFDRASIVNAQLAARATSGQSLREIVQRHTDSGSVLVANSGQALGYLLSRPVVSLVGPHYSTVEWDETAMRGVVDYYGAKLVLITAPNERQPDDSDLIPSSFVRALAGGASPAWLRLVERVGPVSVYQPVRLGPDPSRSVPGCARPD